MTLLKLQTLKKLTVLGLNSGTSADAVDLALLEIRRTPGTVSVRFVQGAERTYPAALRRLILAAASEEEISYQSLLSLDAQLGDFFGKAAADFLKRLPAARKNIHLIASHGQTIQHLPRQITVGGKPQSGTLQLGSLERIAARTHCLTIGDFRQADTALGGEGAPITTPAMVRLFGDIKQSRLVVNIGGIANYFHIPAGTRLDRAPAADIGPGNMLIDALMQQQFDKKYDRNGAAAKKGRADESTIQNLFQHPFFRTASRRSTGREEFGSGLLDRLLAQGKKTRLSEHDLIATATEFTARAIAKKLTPIIRRDQLLTKLYLTGGGSHNKFLTNRLTALLPDISLEPIDSLGIPAGLVEAAAFGVLGETCLRGEALPIHTRTNNNRTTRPILGRIVQPPVTTR